MKLSEAIRGGADMMPELHGEWCTKDSGCAIGSAISYALGNTDWFVGPGASAPDVIYQVHKLFPLGAMPARCPIGNCYDKASIWQCWTIISHLHEWHRWSRKAIAEWVESIENAREVADAEMEKEDAPEEAPASRLAPGIVHVERA